MPWYAQFLRECVCHMYCMHTIVCAQELNNTIVSEMTVLGKLFDQVRDRVALFRNQVIHVVSLFCADFHVHLLEL